MTFGEKFRQARKTASLRQHEVAEAIGVSRQFIWSIEHDEAPFPAAHVTKLPTPMRSAVINALREDIDQQIADLQRRRQGVGN